MAIKPVTWTPDFGTEAFGVSVGGSFEFSDEKYVERLPLEGDNSWVCECE
jgi:hypothetical protein